MVSDRLLIQVAGYQILGFLRPSIHAMPAAGYAYAHHKLGLHYAQPQLRLNQKDNY
ncbi:hypothetical protein [Nostoc sp.]|uniref:hypothetical protein n=1 Tax=Nostoc sp. TaxID=1180 RepID=UPI002FFAC170